MNRAPFPQRLCCTASLSPASHVPLLSIHLAALQYLVVPNALDATLLGKLTDVT
eukprot:COSAG06_NODE_57232_length_281_cov_0.675824_1_plen_53_part_01